jgi:hypothetical protein
VPASPLFPPCVHLWLISVKDVQAFKLFIVVIKYMDCLFVHLWANPLTFLFVNLNLNYKEISCLVHY